MDTDRKLDRKLKRWQKMIVKHNLIILNTETFKKTRWHYFWTAACFTSAYSTTVTIWSDTIKHEVWSSLTRITMFSKIHVSDIFNKYDTLERVIVQSMHAIVVTKNLSETCHVYSSLQYLIFMQNTGRIRCYFSDFTSHKRENFSLVLSMNSNILKLTI